MLSLVSLNGSSGKNKLLFYKIVMLYSVCSSNTVSMRCVFYSSRSLKLQSTFTNVATLGIHYRDSEPASVCSLNAVWQRNRMYHNLWVWWWVVCLGHLIFIRRSVNLDAETLNFLHVFFCLIFQLFGDNFRNNMHKCVLCPST
jgi:hypothetical protein